MIDATVVLYVLLAIIVALLALCYGLVNRLVRQVGQPRINPVGTVKDIIAAHQKDEPVVKTPRPITGSQKVHI